jgi:hypothetical protein
MRVIRLPASMPLLVVLAMLSAHCGYALAGRGNALPASIRIIGIADFINHSTTPDIDRVLTTAVRQEFQTKGKYRINPEAAGADAVIVGTVTSVVAVPVAFTATNLASSYSIVVTADIEFRDVHADRVIWSNPSFRVTDEYDVSNRTDINDAAAIFSQDASALDRLSRRFAREVVSSIFEAF